MSRRVFLLGVGVALVHGRENEVLCQLLCHNICVPIQSQCELGIDVLFWGELHASQDDAPPAAAPAEAAPVTVPAASPPAAPLTKPDDPQPAPRLSCVGA
jgi:hypothetical protein